MTRAYACKACAMSGFDIIGDVHGCADMLKGLLHRLQYEQRDGVFQHPRRKAIFVGDLIDRGSQQIETLEIVRSMVEFESAQIVMGNHEFNAISYATPNPEIPGEFMRQHSDKNRGRNCSPPLMTWSATWENDARIVGNSDRALRV
jgi:hypothetical protein